VLIQGDGSPIERVMVASDLAITKSSYALMRELDALGIPSIALRPGCNWADEVYAQHMPTVTPLNLRTLSPDILAQAIESVLTKPLESTAFELSDFADGAAQAAQAIAKFLPQNESV